MTAILAGPTNELRFRLRSIARSSLRQPQFRNACKAT